MPAAAMQVSSQLCYYSADYFTILLFFTIQLYYTLLHQRLPQPFYCTIILFYTAIHGAPSLPRIHPEHLRRYSRLLLYLLHYYTSDNPLPLQNIFGAILGGFLETDQFPSEIFKLANPAVTLTIKLYEAMCVRYSTV